MCVLCVTIITMCDVFIILLSYVYKYDNALTNMGYNICMHSPCTSHKSNQIKLAQKLYDKKCVQFIEINT